MHNKQVTTGKEGSRGWRWYRIIRCLLEGALGRVGTPPAAVAALRRGLVDTGVVVAVGVGDDRGGRGGRGSGGWRHFCLVGRSGSQVTLGWEDWYGGNGGGTACFYIRERVTPATGTSVKPNSDDHFLFATEAPPFRHPHDHNFGLNFLVFNFRNSRTKKKRNPTWSGPLALPACLRWSFSSTAMKQNVTGFPAPCIFPTFADGSLLCLFGGGDLWWPRHCVFFFFCSR